MDVSPLETFAHSWPGRQGALRAPARLAARALSQISPRGGEAGGRPPGTPALSLPQSKEKPEGAHKGRPLREEPPPAAQRLTGYRLKSKQCKRSAVRRAATVAEQGRQLMFDTSGPARFHLRLLTHRWDLGPEFTNAEGIQSMARAAEDNGFDAVELTHHWIPEADWTANLGIHPLDPWVALGVAAAATTRLRVQTHVLILPYQNPFITAKSAVTVDAVSNGRLILGVGAGFLKPEFDALGVDRAELNDLSDEAIDAMKAAWTGEVFDFDGRHFTARNCVMKPTPVQKPHPPIWVGGNSRKAMSRAIERGDGWIPVAGTLPRTLTPPLSTLDDFRERLDLAREHAERVGRTAPLTLCTGGIGGLDSTYPPGFDHGPVIERILALREMGFSVFTCMLPAESRTEYADNAARFKEKVIDVVNES